MAAAAIPSIVIAVDDYAIGQQCWKEGRYRDAYTHLWRYRETPYGRLAYVDYMLGTSGCRLEDLREWGCDVLEWMLNRYALSEQGRAVVREELSVCRSGNPSMTISTESAMMIASLIGASARASGKTYYWMGRDEHFNSYPAYRVREIPKQEMEARLIPLGARDRALRETQERAPGFNVVVYDRFVLASRSGHAPDMMDKMARYLEQYLRFLEREYGVVLPKTYVTVAVGEARRIRPGRNWAAGTRSTPYRRRPRAGRNRSFRIPAPMASFRFDRINPKEREPPMMSRASGRDMSLMIFKPRSAMVGTGIWRTEKMIPARAERTTGLPTIFLTKNHALCFLSGP